MEIYNLTTPQKSIWFTENSFLNKAVNNICGTLLIKEQVDFKKLEQSINIFLQENDSFRIKLFYDDNNDVKQYIDNIENIDIEICDINSKEELKQLEQKIVKIPFNIIENFLFNIKIFRFSNNQGGFIINAHHLISDARTAGVIVSDNGYILTNEHVSGKKYSNCYVTLSNGKNYNATVVWSDSDIDLSIVKINANGLNYIELGDSDDAKIGQVVYAIGNPIGFEFRQTVTSGIISGLNRTIKIEEGELESYMEDLIQTDATINPGNSGGPLINSEGKMIGINSIKITTAEGIGFAMPINIVKPIITKFIKDGNFDEASIGLFAYDKEVIPYLNINLNFEAGIYIAQVKKNSPAYNSGLKEGDIITKIDGIELNKMSELRSYIYTKNVGDIVNLTISRNNKSLEVSVKLGRKV